MKVLAVFRWVSILNFVSLVICQECQAKFMISRFGVRRSLLQQKYFTIENIGIQQCSRECLLQKMCKAVAYRLRELKCYLGYNEVTVITASLNDIVLSRSTLVKFESQLLKSCLGHSCDESSVCVELSSGTSSCVAGVIRNRTRIESAVTTQENVLSTTKETTIETKSTTIPSEGQTPTVCGNLPTVTGANTPTSTEKSAGTVLTYSCIAGLVTKGNPNTTCQANGQWSALSLTCKHCDTTIYVFNEGLNFCYRIELSHLNTYSNAILHCNSIGGKLAKVDSFRKSLAISLDLHFEQDFQVFVDGTDADQDGTWVYSDGTEVNMALFKNGFPQAGNTNCLSVQADVSRTLDVVCSSYKYSVCEQL